MQQLSPEWLLLPGHLAVLHSVSDARCADARANPEPDPEPDAEPDADSDTSSNTDTDARSDAKSDACAYARARHDAEPDADSDSSSNADTDARGDTRSLSARVVDSGIDVGAGAIEHGFIDDARVCRAANIRASRRVCDTDDCGDDSVPDVD
jgi:hypothetical protein